jgi:RimJ/RimL family protein N-acetyltransferase
VTRLDCGSCVVRDWSSSDKPSLVRHAGNRNVWINLSHLFPHPYTDRDADAWIGYQLSLPEATGWAIEVDGEAVGGIGITPREGIFAKSAEFGYWLGERYWGRGIMSTAVRAVAPWALAHFELLRLESWVFARNVASMRVLEKCGFVREGLLRRSAVKDGEILDRVAYALIDEARTLTPEATTRQTGPSAVSSIRARIPRSET